MQTLKRIYEASFLLGYNDGEKPEYLRNTKDGVFYQALIKNAFTDNNVLDQRGGHVTIGDHIEDKIILGQNRHEPYGGSKYILRARNNSGDTNAIVEGWSGSGNWTALTSAITQTVSTYHEFVAANSATYIFNGTDTVLKTTNGTSASAVATIPKGVDAKWFHNYMFVFGVTGNLSRLYFSAIGDPETYNGTTGWLDINPGDNEPIIALAVLKDELLIFKPSRIWSLTGFSTTDFTLDDVGERVDSIGTIARRSVISTGNDVYYLSFSGSDPQIRSVKRTVQGQIVDGGVISTTINVTMRRLNRSQLSKAAAGYDGRRVWWCVAMDTATENNEALVYDTLTGGWTIHTKIGKMSVLHLSTITGKAELYGGASQASSKSFILNNGLNDDGETVDFEVRTPFYNPQPGYKGRYKYMYITGNSDTDAILDVNYSRDGFQFDDLALVDMTGLGAVYGSAIFGTSAFGETTIIKERLDFAGGPAYFMQYQFLHSELNKKVTLREWELFYYDRALRST